MNSLSGSFTPSKKPQKKVVVDNPFEALKDVGTTTVDAVKEGAQDAIKDMWAQIFGVDQYTAKAQPQKQSGELKPGQSIDLKKQEKRSGSEVATSYLKEIQDAGKSEISKEAHEIRQQLSAIMYELQSLARSSKDIEKQVAQAIGTSIKNPGKYHVNFFASLIQSVRKKAESANTWLQTVKKKKNFVQGMKKNMSQFLSGERSVSNQTA